MLIMGLSVFTDELAHAAEKIPIQFRLGIFSVPLVCPAMPSSIPAMSISTLLDAGRVLKLVAENLAGALASSNDTAMASPSNSRIAVILAELSSSASTPIKKIKVNKIWALAMSAAKSSIPSKPKSGSWPPSSRGEVRQVLRNHH